MRRGRVFIYLLFLLLLIVVAGAVVYMQFILPSQRQAEATPVPTPVVNTVTVVVTAQRVEAADQIIPDMLREVEIPEEQLVETMFTSIADVQGRFARVDLDAGTFLTHGLVVDTVDQVASAVVIPRGMVAVSIPISRLSSVSYAPRAGDHVNVIVSLLFVDLDTDFQTILPNATGAVIGPSPATEDSPPTLTASLVGGDARQGRAEIDPVLGQTIYVNASEDQRPRLVAQTLLQDAVVLRMGNFPLVTERVATSTPDPDAPQTDQAQTAAPEPVIPEVVTLIVSPQDAVTLNYLVYSGAQLTLALRSAEDDSRFDTEAVTLQFLLDQYRIPIPVKLPYGSHPRIDTLVPGGAAPEVAPSP